MGRLEDFLAKFLKLSFTESRCFQHVSKSLFIEHSEKRIAQLLKIDLHKV